MQKDILPYKEIPQEYPEKFSAPLVTARLLDGLGYRYYWATENLRKADLTYKSCETSWTSLEIIRHIHVLAEMVENSIKDRFNVRPTIPNTHGFEKLRKDTLQMIKTSADHFRSLESSDMNAISIKYRRGDKDSSFPLWHHYNGPIADALTHVGQVVLLRRASGNPIDSKVNVFSGKNRS